MEYTQAISRRKIIVTIAILVSALLIAAYYLMPNKTKTSQGGDVSDRLGLKAENPEKKDTYQTATGIVPIAHWILENGVKVYFVQSPSLPIVDIQVTFNAGSARDGEKGGVAFLTNQLLSDGTQNMGADAVAEGFDNLGAQYHAESFRDMAKVSLRSLSYPEQLLPGVALFSEVLGQPTFEEKGFKREQQSTLTLLKHQSQMPNKIASRAFFEQLYPNQPYSNWTYGTPETLAQITPADLKIFHQQYYVKENAVVTIVGDLSLKDAQGIAEIVTKNLPTGNPPEKLPKPLPLKEAVSTSINFPSTQTHILMGEIGVPKGDPDFYALYLGNHVLGGSAMTTRLFKTIREDNGLAYSVYSMFQPMQVAGPFVMGCQTRNEAAEKARDLMISLLKSFIEDGPTDEELQEAKSNLLGGYALNFDSNAAIADQVSAMGFYNLPLDYFNRFKPAIEKVSKSDVQEAFQKHLSPKDILTVMVGPGTQKQGKDEQKS